MLSNGGNKFWATERGRARSRESLNGFVARHVRLSTTILMLRIYALTGVDGHRTGQNRREPAAAAAAVTSAQRTRLVRLVRTWFALVQVLQRGPPNEECLL